MVNMNGEFVGYEKLTKEVRSNTSNSNSSCRGRGDGSLLLVAPWRIYHDREGGVLDVEAGRFVEPRGLVKRATGRVKGGKAKWLVQSRPSNRWISDEI